MCQPPPTAACGRPVRAWNLARRPVLTPRQWCGCYGVMAGVVLMTGAVACVLGYWPIGALCVLEVAAVTAAFVHFSVHALDGERLVLYDDGALEVRVLSGRRESSYRFRGNWLRVEGRWGPSPFQKGLWLACGRERVNIGRHLGEAQGRAVERELRRALYGSALAVDIGSTRLQ